MQNRFVFLLIALTGAGLLLADIAGHAQINTEKFRKYDLERGFLVNFQSTFTLKKGNTEYNALNGAARIDYSGKKVNYFLVGNIEAKTASNQRIQNQGFAHLRTMWKLNPKTNWEFFLQRQYDQFIDLKFRNLAGTAIKYRFFEKQSLRDTASSLDLNISTGIMYEHENYNVEPTNIDKRLLRSTSFISFDWMKKERLNFTGVIYYQPALTNFKDFRVSAETNLEFSIVEKLFFTFQLAYKYNNIPVTDVKRYDLSLENGLRFEFP
jgi:putative salt-induced outer membrane protein YdiY